MPGEPVGKGRPKFARRGNYVNTYTPEKTATYENLVKLKYQEAAHGYVFPDDANLAMMANVYCGIPSSTSKRKRQAMLDGIIRPRKKPDIDNILKSIADACNGVAYKDDVQIVRVECQKFYADMPHVDVEIWETE